jgi:hypothetical protein
MRARLAAVAGANLATLASHVQLRVLSAPMGRRERRGQEQLEREEMKMQNAACWSRLRHIVLGAVALAGAGWFLDAAPSLASEEAGSTGGEPLPKERQSETGAHLTLLIEILPSPSGLR